MIIGISGKIGSGKDTVGKIIQYLTSESSNENSNKYRSFNTFIEKGGGSNLRNFDNHYVSIFEIKKFADKLKDMVCLLINCTREQLEDEEFKNTKLGKEWRIWYMTHYKLSNGDSEGRIGKIYSSEQKLLDYEGSEFFQSLKLDGYQIVSKVLTPRLLLQLLGTDCGRNIIHPNIWVNALMSNYKDVIQEKRGDELTWVTKPNWIITDMRFPNELQAVKDRGGISIRVNRSIPFNTPDGIRWLDYNEWMKNTEREIHESETALDNAIFDYTIDNNGSIEDLIEKVKEILIKEKIL